MQVIRDFDGKGVTVVSNGGNVVTVRAAVFLNMCTRSDGGVTIWGDGRPKAETIRTDKTGNVVSGVKVTKPKVRRKATVTAVKPKAAKTKARGLRYLAG